MKTKISDCEIHCDGYFFQCYYNYCENKEHNTKQDYPFICDYRCLNINLYKGYEKEFIYHAWASLGEPLFLPENISLITKSINVE